MESYHHRWGPADRGARSAFTLVELIVTLVLMAVILGATTSAVLIAGRAFLGGNDVPARATAGDEITRQVLADLRLAQCFTERTAHAVTFRVPDRSGDGTSETIRYAWSGTPGDPLLYQYNGAPETPVELASEVHAFDLAWTVQALGPPPPPPVAIGPEQLLISHDDAPGGGFSTFAMSSAKWGAQYFLPPMPPNAVSWSITRVLVMVVQTGDLGSNLVVEIRNATAELKPGDEVLAATTVPVSSLFDTFTWLEVTFDAMEGFGPATGACVVVHTDNATTTADIQYENAGDPMTAGTHWMSSGNAGEKWTNPGMDKDLRFYVYGRISTLE